MATIYHILINQKKFKKPKGKSHFAVLAFSMLHNTRKLTCFDEKNDDRFQNAYGIKTFSMFFLILGHRLMHTLSSPTLNANFLEEMYDNVGWQLFLNGATLVDTFFTISGLLSSYMLLNSISKNNCIVLYVRRYVRLTPTYFILIFFYCTVFVKLGSGPLWLEKIQVEQENCLYSWWTNLLYLNNYVNTDHICMFQSWYLSCDMQLYLIVPIIVWLLRKHPRVGFWMLIALTILSMFVAAGVVYFTQNNVILLFDIEFFKNLYNDTFKNIYIPSYMRATPFLVGIFSGYVKHQMRRKHLKIPRYMVYVGPALCVLIMNSVIYTGYFFYTPDIAHSATSAVYAFLHRFAWSACVSCIVVGISEGYGDWADVLLNCKPFIVLGKLTYSAFLSHGVIQLYTIASLRKTAYIEVFHTIIFDTVGDIGLAYTSGFFLNMIFEAPIIELWKVVSNKGIQRRKYTKCQQNHHLQNCHIEV